MTHEKIRVLRIFSRLNIGGPSIHVVLLTAGLDRERYQTTLVVGREGDREGSFLDLAESKNVAPIVVPTLGRSIRPIRDLCSFIVLCRLMMRERPHVVHTHTAKAGALGRLAAFVTGVPVVIHTFHGSVFSGYFGALGSRIYKTVERVLARITDAIIGIIRNCCPSRSGPGGCPAPKRKNPGSSSRPNGTGPGFRSSRCWFTGILHGPVLMPDGWCTSVARSLNVTRTVNVHSSAG